MRNSQNVALQDLLFDSLEFPHHPERKRFFPETTFREIVNERTVGRELQRCYRDIHPLNAEALADTICGPRSFRKIFAILTLVERLSYIHKFVEEGIADDDLPLCKIPQPGSNLFRLGCRRGPDSAAQLLQCIDGWSPTVILMFEDWQWATLAPIFHGGECKDVRHIHLESRTPLPFVRDSRYGTVCETIKGGFSTVFKVDIHPAHHTFRGFQVSNL